MGGYAVRFVFFVSSWRAFFFAKGDVFADMHAHETRSTAAGRGDVMISPRFRYRGVTTGTTDYVEHTSLDEMTSKTIMSAQRADVVALIPFVADIHV